MKTKTKNNPNENSSSCDADQLRLAADHLGNAFELLKTAARLSDKAEETCASEDATDEDGNPTPETLAALYDCERGIFPRVGNLRDKAEAEMLKAATIFLDLKEHA